MQEACARRLAPDSSWDLLPRAEFTDLEDSLAPLGFAESRNELLFFEEHEGRDALFSYDLANNRERRLVYAHPTFDMAGVQTLGRYRRLVAATYVDDRPQRVFVDARIEAIHRALANEFPDMNVNITDETVDQRYYLVFVSSATDPGTYYRFDATTNVLAKITAAYPQLASHELVPMRPVRYAADDGIEIPAYLTTPPDRSAPVPAVILPHGGPSARDYWTYDFLAQFLAASGYAVLQANYRGSDGYGKKWQGDGGFRGWRRAMADIAAGTDYLVEEGIADPDKIYEIEVPALLIHGVQDANVPRSQSVTLARALERARRDVELVEYDLAEHSITPERYRTDLLARVGEFLNENLGR